MDFILLSILIFFFGSLIIFPIFHFLENHFYIGSNIRILFYVYAVFGTIIFCCTRLHVAVPLPAIASGLTHRTPLSRLLISVMDSLYGKIAGVPAKNAFMEQFYYPFHITYPNMLLVVLGSFFFAAVALFELFLIYVIYFPELFLVPIIFPHIGSFVSFIRYRFFDKRFEGEETYDIQLMGAQYDSELYQRISRDSGNASASNSNWPTSHYKPFGGNAHQRSTSYVNTVIKSSSKPTNSAQNQSSAAKKKKKDTIMQSDPMVEVNSLNGLAGNDLSDLLHSNDPIDHSHFDS